MLFIQIWDIFCGACSQWKELALVMRKCLPFLIIYANSPSLESALGVFDALSCHLSLIFKHSDTKWDKKQTNKQTVNQILRGAPIARNMGDINVTYRVAPPRYSRFSGS